MKKILFIFSQYRVCERILPVIPFLSEEYELDCLLVYQMKSSHQWPGDKDLREHFYNTYQFDFNFLTEIRSDLDYSSYDLIISDDNRLSTKTKLSEIYNKRKKNMLACYHGAGEKWNNVKFFEDTHGKVYDYTLVMGKDDCKKDYCIPIGVPSNDSLKDKKLNNKHILVVVNFLGNRDCPFKIKLDNHLVNNIDFERLTEVYGLPIIIKLKSREDEGLHQVSRNCEYIDSIMPNVDYKVVVDTEDVDELIIDSKLIISAPSTLAYKPIQLGIPTILIKDSGQLGNFNLFKGLVDSDKEKIKDKIEEMVENPKDVDFIENTVEGGLEFNSTEIFINKIKKLV